MGSEMCIRDRCGGRSKRSPLRLRELHETMTQPLHIGLLGAMPEEIGSDLSHLKDLTCSDHGDLRIHRGS